MVTGLPEGGDCTGGGTGEIGVRRVWLSNPLQFAVILRDVQPEGYLAGLPIWLQHALVGGLTGIGRLFGYKAYTSAYTPA